MPSFTATILKYASNGEKTGWTVIEIPTDILAQLKLKTKKGFRIKGSIDNVKFEKLSTYPVGGGNFIIALNGEIRKKLGKSEGAQVAVKFSLDSSETVKSAELLDALKEEPEALKQFSSLPLSHQNYFHRYVATAKTTPTKTGRIVNTIAAMYKKQDFGEMVRSQKFEKKE